MTHHANELRLMADDPELSTPRREAAKWALGQIGELAEALQLADLALSGAHMNLRVLHRKVRSALAAVKGQTNE